MAARHGEPQRGTGTPRRDSAPRLSGFPLPERRERRVVGPGSLGGQRLEQAPAEGFRRHPGKSADLVGTSGDVRAGRPASGEGTGVRAAPVVTGAA